MIMGAKAISERPLDAETDRLTSYRDRIVALLAEDDFPPGVWSLEGKLAGRELVLYGAGEGSHLFVETVMAIRGIRPALVLDRCFSAGDTFHDVPACPPNNCAWSEARRREALVVVATGKPSLEREMITAALDLGFGEVVPMMSVYEVHQPFSEPLELDSEGYGFFLRNAENILAAFDLLQDEQSRAIFWGVLRNHCLRRPEPLPMGPKEEHNFPTDLPFSINYGNYLCCGAPDGWHLARVLQGPTQRMLIVDPEKVPLLPVTSADVIVMPCALDERDEIVPFTRTSTERGNTFGCRILPSGETFARAARIDTVIGTMSPSFISMDIEGAELRALKGAYQTIVKSRPTLAICIYHSVDHLWAIPLYINGLGLGYRFWMRNYCSFTAETVVYAYSEHPQDI